MSFIRYNANPKDLTCQDCVIRALSKALDTTWENVYDGLYEIGRSKKRMLNDPKVYEKYLKDNGFVKCTSKRDSNGKLITIEEFMNRSYTDEIYVIHTRRHLTTIYKGDVYDTWNTLSQKAGKYYVKDI